MNLYEKYNWLFNESSKPIPGLIKRYYDQYQDGTPVPDGFVYDWNRDQSVKVPSQEEEEDGGDVEVPNIPYGEWLAEKPFDYNRDGVVDENDYKIWSLNQYGYSIIDLVLMFPDWFPNVIYYDPSMGRDVFPVQTPNGIQIVMAPFNNNEAGYYVIGQDGSLIPLEEYFAPFQYELDVEEAGQP
tara:strand:- start:101 stop:652 length:552 start_codon:yes stop_codon:yes gene_type:complete